MTKKFWCHYVGGDGNTPKRRNIELTNLADKLPAIGDNVNCATPIWYDYDEHYKIYEIYVQLSETVAVSTLIAGVINGGVMDFMLKTDADFEAERDESIKSIMANTWDSSFTPEKKAASCEARKRRCEDSKRRRDEHIAKVMQYKDYTNMLLNGSWIANATVRAYEEAQSPYLPVIQELRRQNMEKRDAEIKADKERRRKAAEEEARKKAEAEQKEQERLTQEAEKFKNGEAIAGSDVVDLCRRYGIAIHLRTVHNLQQVIYVINGKTGTCQYYRQSKGKRRPQLDGCYKTAGELYQYLQTH